MSTKFLILLMLLTASRDNCQHGSELGYNGDAASSKRNKRRHDHARCDDGHPVLISADNARHHTRGKYA